MADVKITARWDGSAVQQGIQSLKAAAVGLGVAFGLRELSQGIQAIVKDTAAEERGLIRMAGSLKNVGVSGQGIKQITDYIGELQDATQFADDDITAAFTRMVQATGDVNASLTELTDAMDVAAATGKTLEEAGNVVAMAMQGQVRGLGQLLPSLKTYLENLEGVEDPAQRAALALDAMRKAFGGAAKEDLNAFNAALDGLKNVLSEIGNVLAEKSGLIKWLKEMTDGFKVMAVAMREGIPLSEAIAKMETAPTAPTVTANPPPNGGNAGGEQRARGGPIGEGTMGENFWLPANMGQRGPRSTPMRLSVEGLDDAREQWKKFSEDSALQFKLAQMAAHKELAESLKSGLMGAFDAATQGGKAFVDYLKNYFKQALVELAAGGLVNALIPGAGVGMGILGKIFSHGASASMDRNLTMRRMRLG